MGDNQRHAILSNEIIRRLSVIDMEHHGPGEVMEVLEEIIQEMKSSGYKREKIREMVIDGVKGWKRKIERRRLNGEDLYRTAKKTLKTRIRKKLTEKENWFKDKEIDEEAIDEEKKRGKRKIGDREEKPKPNNVVKAVMTAGWDKVLHFVGRSLLNRIFRPK